MPTNHQKEIKFLRIINLIVILLMLNGCDNFNQLIKGLTPTEDTTPITKLTLAVAPNITWMPWFLAAEENLFAKEYAQKYRVEVQFTTSDYQDTIKQFIDGEVQALAITNIEAIAQLIKQEVEADVILIMSYSNGNEAIVLPATNTDTNVLRVREKTFALLKNTTSHYLLDRYLVRNQIPFDDVPIQNTLAADIPKALMDKNIYGVVTSHPTISKLIREQHAKVHFDSRAIPREIMDLLIVRREVLTKTPKFGPALLAAWFAIMERLQGNRRGGTLDAMTQLSNVTREDFDRQMAAVILNDTPIKALSAVRDRKISKTMRHLRYFMERHALTGSESFNNWVSYPGRTPATLHFNGNVLQEYITPISGK